jgi:hypothetical protein
MAGVINFEQMSASLRERLSILAPILMGKKPACPDGLKLPVVTDKTKQGECSIIMKNDHFEVKMNQF